MVGASSSEVFVKVVNLSNCNAFLALSRCSAWHIQNNEIANTHMNEFEDINCHPQYSGT